MSELDWGWDADDIAAMAEKKRKWDALTEDQQLCHNLRNYSTYGHHGADAIERLIRERDEAQARIKVLEEALTKARASLGGVIGLYGLKTFTGSVVAWDEQPLHVRKVMEAELEARKALEPSLSLEDKPA